MMKKAENEETTCATSSGRRGDHNVGRRIEPPEFLGRQESPHQQEATNNVSGALQQEELCSPQGEEISSEDLLSQEAWSSSATRMMMPSRTSFAMVGHASSLSSSSSAPALSSAPAADNNPARGAHPPGGANESTRILLHAILTSAMAVGPFCDNSDDEGMEFFYNDDILLHEGLSPNHTFTTTAGASTTRTAIAHDGEEDETSSLPAVVPSSVRPASSSSSPTTATATTLLHSSQQGCSQLERQQRGNEGDSASAGGLGYHHACFYPPTILPSSLLAPHPSASRSQRARSRAAYHHRERRHRRFLDQ
jgi:hypothetical protein